MYVCVRRYLVEVLMQTIHEEEEELLRVLLLASGELLVNLADGDFKISGADVLKLP